MFKRLANARDIVGNLHSTVEYSVKYYERYLDGINSVGLGVFSDGQLKEMSRKLKSRVQIDGVTDELVVQSFALVREAGARVLGLRAYDVQVLAAVALHVGKIVEMQTGEGKTLAAIFPAYANSLCGRGVHVLTFNDYLAQRDYEWMGPVYEFLGITVGCVQEGMDIAGRQQAYGADVTYLTAKESGFDYLRDFLCTEPELLVHRPFHYAIVDEADSILIDEARIPLVVAGNVPEPAGLLPDLPALIGSLKQGRDYEVDLYERDVFLSDAGLVRVEGILGCGNLYDPCNLELLTSVNCALHAGILLEKDKDYIVREGRVELIDLFTGRIAKKRHWPDGLQAAVEAKEGLAAQSSGKIMGSLTLQNFINLYPKLSGMTGTARTAAPEFFSLYGKEVAVIPTNKPCVRKDHADRVFTHKEAKVKAVLAEISRAHQKGQPVLVGTDSVAESERLATELIRAGIQCRVLNAKNDEMEARVIASAGEHGAVTVSTNMAGRGVDIKLGGDGGAGRDNVVAAGGLYVIGTTRHESRRIDDQLRGRAGRQGDAGESRFFVSLEDDIILRYGMDSLMPSDRARQDEVLEDSLYRQTIAKGQRYVEGYHAEVRMQLCKYWYVLEQQRHIMHMRRLDVLMGRLSSELLSTHAPERYHKLCCQLGEHVLGQAEKQLTLFYINKCWSDYLQEMACVRESIHLVVIGKQSPLDEFHKIAIAAYSEMLGRIDAGIIHSFETVEITESGIDMKKEGLLGPSSTWTYLVNDSPDQYSNLPELLRGLVTSFRGPLFSARSLYRRLFNRKD